MNENNPNLSVIIVSWNTRELVCQCLKSLETARRHLRLEIVLVDNASTDNTVEVVRESFPYVNVVQNPKNLGFAKANNIGIALSSGDYLALINSDVVVREGCLERMTAYMEKHLDIGMLGPKMIMPDGTLGQSCMRFPTVWNWFCNALALDSVLRGSALAGDFMMEDFKYDQTLDVDVLTGWFWMLRREAVDEVGVLDDRFFMYGEDIDWPKRFHLNGWRVVFYPEAEAVHFCGASSGLAPRRFYLEMCRANLQYFGKHHSRTAVIGFWLATWLHQVTRVVVYGLLYLVKRSNRSISAYKMQRSAMCLLWLMGLKTLEGVK